MQPAYAELLKSCQHPSKPSNSKDLRDFKTEGTKQSNSHQNQATTNPENTCIFSDIMIYVLGVPVQMISPVQALPRLASFYVLLFI